MRVGRGREDRMYQCGAFRSHREAYFRGTFDSEPTTPRAMVVARSKGLMWGKGVIPFYSCPIWGRDGASVCSWVRPKGNYCAPTQPTWSNDIFVLPGKRRLSRCLGLFFFSFFPVFCFFGVSLFGVLRDECCLFCF